MLKFSHALRCEKTPLSIGLPPDSRDFHDAFWPKLREANFARRRAYDWRAALLLIQQGVTEFATVNEKDFRDCGFQRVWNPLAADSTP